MNSQLLRTIGTWTISHFPPLEHLTGKENMTPAGVLYEPSEKTAMETHEPYRIENM